MMKAALQIVRLYVDGGFYLWRGMENPIDFMLFYDYNRDTMLKAHCIAAKRSVRKAEFIWRT